MGRGAKAPRSCPILARWRALADVRRGLASNCPKEALLVTGATGFIGAAVARKLLQQRHEVLALSRSERRGREALRVAGLTPVAVMTKVLGESGKPLIFTSGSALRENSRKAQRSSRRYVPLGR
jgi:NAD dependent epimerase/dehydratase family